VGRLSRAGPLRRHAAVAANAPRPGLPRGVPQLHPLADVRAGRVIVDAELVCLDSDGRPDFGQLRSSVTGRAPMRRATAQEIPSDSRAPVQWYLHRVAAAPPEASGAYHPRILGA